MSPLVDELVAHSAGVESVGVPVCAACVMLFAELAYVVAVTVLRAFELEACVAQVYFVQGRDCAWGGL